MENKQNIQMWLNTAVSGIRFKPDRAAVEEELRGHFEDKVADLQRMYHLDQDDAEEMALERMGDAREIGREMAKIHKPWLGYLWRASQVLLVGVIALWLVISCFDLKEEPLWGWNVEEWECVPTVAVSPKAARLGRYHFSIKEAVYMDYPEDGHLRDRIRVVFRVSTPWFWGNIKDSALQEALILETDDGMRWPMDRQTVAVEVGVYQQVLNGMEERKRGWFYREYVCYALTEWEKGDRVTLWFDFIQGDVSLSAELVRIEEGTA